MSAIVRPNNLLFQFGHSNSYVSVPDSAYDYFIPITFPTPYTTWCLVFCNIPAQMVRTGTITGYIHNATARSVTLTGCQLFAFYAYINNGTIQSLGKDPSEGIAWMSVGI